MEYHITKVRLRLDVAEIDINNNLDKTCVYFWSSNLIMNFNHCHPDIMNLEEIIVIWLMDSIRYKETTKNWGDRCLFKDIFHLFDFSSL